MGNEYSLQLEDERQTNASRAAQRHLPVIRVKPDPNVCKGVCVLSFYCVAVGAVMVQSSFLSYKIIQTYMTDSKGKQMPFEFF